MIAQKSKKFSDVKRHLHDNNFSFLKTASIICCFLVLLSSSVYSQEPLSIQQKIKILESIEVDSVPADFPVGFSSVSHNNWQFLAYYNKNRNMTVASRKVSEDKWNYKVLPTKVGWDSHNRISMTMDRDFCLHVSGNMHNDSMTYFKTEKPLDISSFEKIFPLVNIIDEVSCTYPSFIKTKDKQVIYSYRIGGSRNGVTITNSYNEKTKLFERLTDKPLFDGLGEMSAYASGPRLGPDGNYHVVWLWRNTPHCETNHSLSYAQSSDLIHWENMQGINSELPITPRTKIFIADPVQAGGGAINGAFKLFFDHENKPLLAYMKYDEKGDNQFYVAKEDQGKWMIKQVSDWKYRWEFLGSGSITFEIRLKHARVTNDNQIEIGYRHKTRGDGELIVDLESLSLIEDKKVEVVERLEYPKQLMQVTRSEEGMNVHWKKLRSTNPNSSDYYGLRWETMGKRRFYKAPENPVNPSVLKLYKLEEQN